MRNYKVLVNARAGKYNVKPKGGRTPQESCHIAKSFAGTIYQADNVYSVEVQDGFGQVFLRLDKFCDSRFVNVPSECARQI